MAAISTLIDDFQDNVINTSLWSVSGSCVETGGRAKLTPTTSFSFWNSAATGYDLTDSQFVAQIPVITSNGSTGTLQSGMVIALDPNNVVGMRKLGSDLICSKKVGGTSTDLSFALYSSTNHKFWRIRCDSSNIYWETSATGSGAFFIQNTESLSSVGFSLTSLYVYFFSGYSGVEAFPGTFQIEAVNPGLPLTASGASASTGSLALLITAPDQITASGLSTSTGSLTFIIVPASTLYVAAAGSSTSTGHLALSTVIVKSITASGVSTSSGSLVFSILSTGHFSSSAFSTSTGSLILTTHITSDVGLWIFEPPVAYDNPTTLPPPFPQIRNSYARWQKGAPRGRSVLRTGNVCQVVDTPTVDQTLAADRYYAGGHTYIIDDAEASLLFACGLMVMPLPISFTLFPNDNVFPQTDTFPGYQDLVLP